MNSVKLSYKALIVRNDADPKRPFSTEIVFGTWSGAPIEATIFDLAQTDASRAVRKVQAYSATRETHLALHGAIQDVANGDTLRAVALTPRGEAEELTVTFQPYGLLIYSGDRQSAVAALDFTKASIGGDRDLYASAVVFPGAATPGEPQVQAVETWEQAAALFERHGINAALGEPKAPQPQLAAGPGMR